MSKDTSAEDQKTLESFLHMLTLLCDRFGVEINGCFSVSIAGREHATESEDDTDVVRNIESVSEIGVVRTLSRGNRP